MSLRMPRAKAGMLREEQKTEPKNDCFKDVVSKRGIREDRKQKHGCAKRQCVGEVRFVGGRKNDQEL